MADNSNAIKISKISLNSDNMFKLISEPVPGFSSLSADRGVMQLKLPNKTVCHVTVTEKCMAWTKRLKLQCQMLPMLPGSKQVAVSGDTLTVTVTTLARTPMCVALLCTCDCPHHSWMCPFHHTGIPSRSIDQLSSSKAVRLALQRSSMILKQSHGSLCSADAPLLLSFLIFPVCALKGE